MLLKDLNKVNIKSLLELDIIDFETYISLDNVKTLKYTNNEYDNRDVLVKFLNRGKTEVYLTNTEYKRYIKTQIRKNKEKNKAALAEKNKSIKSLINDIQRDHDLIHSMINKIGIDQETFEMVEDLNAETFAVINDIRDIRSLLRDFKKQSKIGYAKNMLTSFFLVKMTQHFTWANKDKMLERLSLGVFLANLGLKDKDLDLIKELKSSELPKHIIENSNKVVELYQKKEERLHEDVKLMILQHNERPDGRGFPGGLEARHINLYASLYIVAFDFTEILFEGNLSFEAIQNSIKEMEIKYAKYLKLTNNISRSYEAYISMCKKIGLITDSSSAKEGISA